VNNTDVEEPNPGFNSKLDINCKLMLIQKHVVLVKSPSPLSYMSK